MGRVCGLTIKKEQPNYLYYSLFFTSMIITLTNEIDLGCSNFKKPRV